MKKFILLFTLVMFFSVHNATAALVTGDVLAFGEGSYFAMDMNSDGAFTSEEQFAISMFEGLRIGAIQTASGSHSGVPDGSESPSIDNPWQFSGNTGMHSTTSAVTEVSPGVLDFSGWAVNWNGALIPMGGDLLRGDTGLASIACTSLTCSTGSSFVLEYFAHIQQVDPSNKGGVKYALHLEGRVNTVPVPAAIWLFGSGLIGFAGFMRRRKVA